MDKEELIKEIIALEWSMFSTVNNTDGTAQCQTRPDIFKIMRSSQYAPWSNELLASWLEDLRIAKQAGRNLATEKYARMMEKTHPEEFIEISSLLKPTDPDTAEKIEEIINVHLGWKKELEKKYPYLSKRGRPANTDLLHALPSMATYLRAELQTYSPKTVNIYHREVLERKKKGGNEAEENLLAQVKQYGFADLNTAEEKYARQDVNA